MAAKINIRQALALSRAYNSVILLAVAILGHGRLTTDELCLKSFYCIINFYYVKKRCFSWLLTNHAVVLVIRMSRSIGPFENNSIENTKKNLIPYNRVV